MTWYHVFCSRNGAVADCYCRTYEEARRFMDAMCSAGWFVQIGAQDKIR